MSRDVNSESSPEVVIALYRPHEGKDADLRALIDEHLPTLQRLELITNRPSILMRAEDGTYLEVFEWCDGDAARRAHEHPEVAAVWERMAQVADLPELGSLPEANRRFPHFRPV